MTSLKYKIYSALPNLSIKNKIWCYHSNKKNKELRMVYRNGYFETFLKKFSIKTYDNFFYEWHCVKGYIQKYLPKKGDVVIDCGAGFGAFALFAAKLIGDEGTVFAFEPDPINFERLKKNIRLNKLNNIKIIKKIIINEDNGQIAFNCLGNDCSSVNLNLTKEKNIKMIPAVTLDKEFERIGVKKINFIKMDIEGSEIEALKGAKNLMKKFPINFAIASYHIVNRKKTCYELEKIFKKRKYFYETCYPLHLTTYARPINNKSKIKNSNQIIIL